MIAGHYRGRRLKVPSWTGLRPTSDKLRETLFNILAPRIEGARLLDAFAGTGAVGIEALSRGASHVTFVDADRRALALIEANLAICGIEEGYTIERGDLVAVLRRAGTPCELEQLRGLPRRRTVAVARRLGVPVRIYVPFGPGWWPYAINQALARPYLPLWALRDALAIRG